MPITYAIVEDEAPIRTMTVSLLNYYPDLTCVGAYADALTFMANLPEIEPQVVLMDIGLSTSGMTGTACVDLCHARYPEVEFVMFTSHTNPVEVFEALAAGAAGYILKDAAPERIAGAIREAARKEAPLTGQIARLILESFRVMRSHHPGLDDLTEQEWTVLENLDKGLTYQQIADAKFVTINTVRTQIQSIYQKLQVHNRTGALDIYRTYKGRPRRGKK
ncbi:MAG: response regulator transcription factor [Bacteroidia bacterium]|nr:response regulator transcription factor [Bacteroidia bacterium]